MDAVLLTLLTFTGRSDQGVASTTCSVSSVDGYKTCAAAVGAIDSYAESYSSCCSLCVIYMYYTVIRAAPP
jgi:hypothetical protein